MTKPHTVKNYFKNITKKWGFWLLQNNLTFFKILYSPCFAFYNPAFSGSLRLPIAMQAIETNTANKIF